MYLFLPPEVMRFLKKDSKKYVSICSFNNNDYIWTSIIYTFKLILLTFLLGEYMYFQDLLQIGNTPVYYIMVMISIAVL